MRATTAPPSQLALTHPLQHQPVEPRGERGRVFRQLAIEDLRLLQQQEGEVIRGGLVAGAFRDRASQRMAQMISTKTISELTV
jgi:hypothetical protein